MPIARYFRSLVQRQPREGTRTGPPKPRCVVVTVMWGDWHVGAFLSVNLPTMLAPGNLPALAKEVDVEYLIFTRAEDRERLQADKGFARLSELFPISIETFVPDPSINVMTVHHDFWIRGMARAKEIDAFVLLMPPDVLWSDGSFGKLAEALNAGKQLIFMAFPRVVSETLIPSLHTRFHQDADSTLSISSDDLMALALMHIHPLMAGLRRSASHYLVHPEMVVWPVKDEGLLIRLPARELFCFKPDRHELTPQALLAKMPPLDEIHVFQDSREYLGLSLAPFWKDMDWYLRPTKADPLFIGAWWLAYESPFNDYMSRLDMRFGLSKRDEAAWRRASQSAESLFNHARFAREFVRVLRMLERKGGFELASGYLAAAIRVHGVARRWPHRGPFVLLVPTDIAIANPSDLRFPGDNTTCAEVLNILGHYVALLPEGGVKKGAKLKTLSGSTAIIDGSMSVDACGQNVIVPIKALLHTTGKSRTSSP